MNKFKHQFQEIFWHISLSDRMLFVKHLSIMIRSGMPILDSLWLLRRQAKSKTLQKIISELIVDVDNGQFLSVSLEKHKGVFGNFFINIIRVGEASGTLADNLNYLHEEIRKSYELRKKVKAAMTYPIILLVAVFGISTLLMFSIFPKILPIFATFKMKLPISTRILIVVANFSIHNGVYMFVGFIVFIAAIIILLRINVIKILYHRLLLSTPFIGNISLHVNMTAFARTMSSLLRSGIKIVDALLIVADTMPNFVYRRQLKNVSESVKRGEPMSKYMLVNEKFFPPTFSQMVEVGENTGHLDENLVYLAEFYEAEVDEMFKNLSTILEPLLLLVMGIIVGFVALAIITPIYGLTQSLKIK
ncbi:hypothetical protein A2999_00895 [Candidatus Wolfebacteria bacterium RIFCSPLOWO2_01_FULL_38_11]|uniref:Type II secretion system protein n=2 Tax=Candidatus Wolfeibacteriota TaxID=1752735 RepID=A0A0G0IDN6_9BACT|nr:MAG: Type II secretion system protein [Candidatus Wolfebacteria bacterium GW2011_GWC1_37_10]OGM90476.1 MAG: hypothetical protein A2999_00895 [Candidatus Wolfebacteria bacterium RIFCSPLOWO2_01_FULL_38_11]